MRAGWTADARDYKLTRPRATVQSRASTRLAGADARMQRNAKMMRAILIAFISLAFSAFAPAPVAAENVTAREGMVVAQEARAARVGRDILQQGGNVVDAAVATAFALAVTY